MNCMKCGRKIQPEQVFCQECLQEMEKYPVHSSVVVLLPRRRESVVIKKVPKRHVPTAEEQIRFFRKWTLILAVLLALSIALIALMAKPALQHIMEDHFAIGQNYTSVSPSPSAATE